MGATIIPAGGADILGIANSWTANQTVTGTASATAGSIKSINSNASAVGMAAMLSNLSANNAANAAELGFSFNNSTPAETQFAGIRVISSTVTAGGETGTMLFRIMEAGTMTTAMQIGGSGAILINGGTDPGVAGSIAAVIPGNNQGFRMYSTNFNGSARGWGFRINTAANGDMSIMQSSSNTGDPFTNHRLYFGPSGGVNIGATGDVAAGNISVSGSAILSQAALATNATTGFTYLPTSAGVPTGAAGAFTGTVATEYDTTSNLLWVYNGAWKAPGQQLTVGDAGLLTISQGTTYYAGEVGVSTTEANVQFPVSVPCTFSRMYVKLSGNVGGAGQTVVVTARLNGAGQTLTTTINSGASTGNDTTNSFSAVAGDLISFSVVTSATTGSFSQISITVCR